MSSHIVTVPRWILGLRIAQIVNAVIVLGLNSYGVHYISYKVFAFSICIACATIIVLVYILVASLAAPKAYNLWAVLSLEIFEVFVWLIAFALLAALSETWTVDCSYSPYSGYYSCYKRRDLTVRKRDTDESTYYGTLVASAVFGAIEFVLFLISLITFSVYLHRHRKSGIPATASGSAALPIGYPPVYNIGMPLDKLGAQTRPVEQVQYDQVEALRTDSSA